MIYIYSVFLFVGTCMSITSALPPCVCTKDIRPVCGSDGQTYNNECLLECERTKNKDLSLAYKGKCRTKRMPPCLCSREARLVCGTDGHTYNNPCMLNCAKEDNTDLQLDHEGQCETVKREINPQQARMRV